MKNRQLIVASSTGYAPRREKLDGRDYLVVPVVGLVEGVVHALNAKHGPEFVPKSVFMSEPQRWEGKPLYEGHPLFNGKPVRGNVPHLVQHRSVGLVRHPQVTDDRLTMEAWLDEANCKLRAPELHARAEAGEPIEISVGVLVAADEDATGTHNGRDYFATWAEYEPDHLALLPDGVKGACSREMGCGVRAAEDASDIEDPEDMDDRFAYSPDQERDERGMFVAASAAHQKAAEAHAKAAAGHAAGSAKSAGAVHSATLKADKASDHANGMSRGLVKTTHGDEAKYHASRAVTNSRANIHGAAQTHHEAASHHHAAIAKLIGRIGELHDELKVHEAQGANMDSMYLAWLEAGSEDLVRDLRDISQDVRDKLPKEDFAGPNESFPIEQPIDVHDAAQALGRAKGDRASIKRRIIAIAYRKGASFVAQLPDDWKKQSDQRAASSFARFMEDVRSLLKADPDLEVLWPDKNGEDDHGRAASAHNKAATAHQNAAKSTSLAASNKVHEMSEKAMHATDKATKSVPSKGHEAENYSSEAFNRSSSAIGYREAGAHNSASSHHELAANSHWTAANAHKEQQRRMRRQSRNAQDADQMGRNDLMKRLYEALAEVEPTLTNVEDYFPVTDPAHVVYSCYDGMSAWCMYERSFTLSDAGVVTLSDAKVEVQATTKYEPVEGASPTTLETNAGAGAPGSSDETPIQGADDMKKEELVKALEKATDCQLQALADVLEGKATVTKAPTAEELRAAEDARSEAVTKAAKAIAEEAVRGLTFDQLLEKADAGTRDMVASGRALGQAKKEKTIEGLKATGRCKLTDEALKAMSQADLDNLVELAGSNVRAAIDFGGTGAPKGKGAAEVPDAPSLEDRIRAAAAARK